MNSRKINGKLIENITVEVVNTASISKDVLFHVSKFFEKMVFQFIFEIIKWIHQIQLLRQTVQTIGVRKKIFDQNTCFLKDVLVSKYKISYFLNFDQIVYKYIMKI